MTRDQLLAQKLDELSERTVSGHTTSAAELCRDSPELLAELERCLKAMHAVDCLRLPRNANVEPGGDTQSLAVAAGAPRQLGRYRLEALLGAGGMGEVWRAFDSQLERPVAVKLLHENLAADAIAKARFLREARAAAKLHHDNVVGIFDAGEIDGNLVLAMPLLKGETLDSRVRRDGALSASEVAQAGAELFEGLSAAHKAGLIHRDVKPSNVWLEQPNSRAMLLDFGLARPETGEGLTQAGGIFGTPGYMSPEQARGEPLDFRTDLFSAGAVLYFAATGKAPFAGPGINTLAVLERTKTYEPAAPCLVRPDLPVALSDFILVLLQKDRNGRPNSAEEAAVHLRRLAGLPSASREQEVEPSEKPTGKVAIADTERMTGAAEQRAPIRRRPALIAGVAAILLIAGWAGRAIWKASIGRNNNVSSLSHAEQPWSGQLDVKVGRDPKKDDRAYSLNHPSILPLQPGRDWIWIHARLNRPAFIYIVWIDTEGQASLLHPWVEALKRRPAEEQPVEEFHWPSETRGGKLGGGPAGTESLILLARSEKLADDVDVTALFAGLPKQRSRFVQEAAWFENGQLVIDDRERSSIGFDIERGRPDARNTAEIADPVIRLQVLLRSNEIRRLFPYTRGVCFSNAGDR